MSTKFQSNLVALLWFVIPSTATITASSADCHNYAECIQQEIDSHYVNCYGDLSCDASTINSLDTDNLFDGYIACSGEESCKRSGLTAYNIFCSGHESCYFPDYIVAQNDVICSGDHSCHSNEYVASDPHIKSITSNVLCQGTGSCLMAKIESTANTYCSAHESCSTSTINSGHKYIYMYSPILCICYI